MADNYTRDLAFLNAVHPHDPLLSGQEKQIGFLNAGDLDPRVRQEILMKMLQNHIASGGTSDKSGTMQRLVDPESGNAPWSHSDNVNYMRSRAVMRDDPQANTAMDFWTSEIRRANRM